MPLSLHAIVSGKVQGVYYRAWARDQARLMKMSGWARNCEDGSVEILAQGDEKALERLGKILHRGSPFSRVDKIVQKIIDHPETYSDFLIRF